MKRKRPLKPSKPLKATRQPVRPKNPARAAQAFARAYGGEDRVAWVRAQPCLLGCAPPSQNAHVRTGGMGRKADAAQIVPLCAAHHEELHRHGTRTFEATHRVLLDVWAAIVDDRWHRHRRKVLT